MVARASSAPAWPALLLAPLLAVGDVSLAYALVSPSCSRQDNVALHAVMAVSLVLALGMTAYAWRQWSFAAATAGHRGPGRATYSDGSEAAARPGFVALMATLIGALSSLVIIAVWMPMWILPPCS